MTRSGFERFVAAGMQAVGTDATDGSRRHLEAAVRQLLATAVDRGEAVVDEWVGRGRRSSAEVTEVLEVVRREVARQTALAGARLDDVESRLRTLAGTTDSPAVESSPTLEPTPGARQPRQEEAQTKSTATKKKKKKNNNKKRRQGQDSSAKTPPREKNEQATKGKRKKKKKKKKKKDKGSKRQKAGRSDSTKRQKSATADSTKRQKSATADSTTRPTNTSTPRIERSGRAGGAAVGSSGVGRIATTRAERDSA